MNDICKNWCLIILYRNKLKKKQTMNTEHELFGELHEQEENSLFGNEHRRQYEAQQEALRLSAVSYQLPHYFNAPDEDKGSRFCRCGKYLTDEIHLR